MPRLYEPPRMRKPLGCLPSCSTLRQQWLPGTRTGMFHRQDRPTMVHTEQSKVWAPLPPQPMAAQPAVASAKTLGGGPSLTPPFPTPHIHSLSRWSSSSPSNNP